MPTPFEFGHRVKTAIEIEQGDMLNRLLGAAAGRYNSVHNMAPLANQILADTGLRKIPSGGTGLSLPGSAAPGELKHVPFVPHAMLTPETLRDSAPLHQGNFGSQIRPQDARGMALKSLAERMYAANPEALKGHKIYLGGANMRDQIKRVWKNPNLSTGAKAVGTVAAPLASLYTAWNRADHYNPFSNTTTLYSNSPAVLSHELGHAIDANTLQPGRRGWFGRQGKPMSNIWSGKTLGKEFAANRLSEQTLRQAYKDDPAALNQILHDRQKVLPAGIGSYLGAQIGQGANLLSLAGKLVPGANKYIPTKFIDNYAKYAPMAGMGAGKLYGLSAAALRKGKYVKPEPAAKPAA